MATSGSVSTSAYLDSKGNPINLTFEWTVSSRNIAAKTTTISWTLKGGGTTTFWFKTRAIKLTLDGAEVYTFPGSSSSYKELGVGTVVATGTHTFTHATDGTKSFTAYVEAGIYTWDVNCTGSKTFTLDKIPDASVPSVSVSSVDMGGKVTIYTNWTDNTMAHDLAYSFAGGSYVAIATGVGASYAWTVPDLASSIPNTTSGTVTIRCITKSDGTTIGTKTVTMTLKVPASVVPTISAVAISEATDGLAAQFGAYIQGKSTLAVKTTAAGVKGSTISTISNVVQGVTYTGASITTEAITASGSVNVVTTVTDSRGRTASKTSTITVLDYAPPKTIEFKAYRCDEAGNAKDDGDRLGVFYEYSVSSCGGKNTADMVIEYKTETGGRWADLASRHDLYSFDYILFSDGPVFSTDYQYDIRMTVTDWFGATTSYTVTLPTADVVLDISSDGTGLGIGKVSQRSEATEFARVLYDRFDTVIGNGLAVYTGSGANAIDPDTTLEHLIVTDHENAPGYSGFWYVTTQFYSTKSETANRTQLAMPYSTSGALWARRFYNGVWSAWTAVQIMAQEYDSGIWHVRHWSDGWVEMTGTYEVSSLACTTTFGNWFRTAEINVGKFPVTLDNPVVTANYEGTGYTALLWATNEATNSAPPAYYLIRPASATIASGRVQLRVTGRAV